MPTSPPAISALPTPPSTSSPTNFDSQADAFLGALPDLASDIGAVASNVYANAVEAASSASTASTAATTASTAATTALNAPATQATSSTSLTIGGGSISLTLSQAGKAFAVGQWVTVADTAAPSTRWFAGAISAFNSGSGAMTVDVAYTAGSGSATSWAVVPSSPLGVIGRFYSDVTVPSLNGGQLAGLRNRIINGNFGINQRVVSGSVVLAAGAYGHDRWKAGAAGCTYTFATSNNVTTLTISAGSLQQVVEGLNLESGTYCLSWTGTAQGKVGAGAYSASGVTRAVTGGTNTTIEFNTGTLSLVQLEIGSATTFEQRPYATELLLCLRYYQRLQMEQRFTATGVGQVLTVTRTTAVPMRASPTFTQITAGTLTNASAATMTAVTASEAQAVLTASGSGDCFVTARVFETSGTEL